MIQRYSGGDLALESGHFVRKDRERWSRREDAAGSWARRSVAEARLARKRVATLPSAVSSMRVACRVVGVGARLVSKGRSLVVLSWTRCAAVGLVLGG